MFRENDDPIGFKYTLIASNIKKAGRLSLAVDVLEHAVKALIEEM
jgi:hypothetical protein